MFRAHASESGWALASIAKSPGIAVLALVSVRVLWEKGQTGQSPNRLKYTLIALALTQFKFEYTV
jgi:cytochrome b561